jgi:hypothetical protein
MIQKTKRKQKKEEAQAKEVQQSSRSDNNEKTPHRRAKHIQANPGRLGAKTNYSKLKIREQKTAGGMPAAQSRSTRRSLGWGQQLKQRARGTNRVSLILFLLQTQQQGSVDIRGRHIEHGGVDYSSGSITTNLL